MSICHFELISLSFSIFLTIFLQNYAAKCSYYNNYKSHIQNQIPTALKNSLE